MHSLTNKFVLCAIIVGVRALSDAQLDLSPPFPTCAVDAATAGVYSTRCQSTSLECVCTDPDYQSAYLLASIDYCKDTAERRLGLVMITAQCASAGLPISIPSGPSIFVTPSAYIPSGASYPTETATESWWSIPSESATCYEWYCNSSRVPKTTTIHHTMTAPCTDNTATATPASTAITTPVSNVTATGSTTASTTRPIVTGGAISHGEKVPGMVGLVVALLGVAVMV